MSFKLTEKQDEAIKLFASDSVYTLLYGGSRSSKTFTTLRTIIWRAISVPGSRHCVLRYRFNHIISSVVLDTFPKVMELCFPGCQFKLNKSAWYVTFPNGSEIWFGGLDEKDRAEKILGNEYATIFLNECSQISYHAYLLIITRLAQRCMYKVGNETKELRLKLFLDENPPAKGHWTYKLFIEGKDPESKKKLSNPEAYCSLLMNPKDNADNLSQTYIDLLKNLPKSKRDRFWLGKFNDNAENALWNAELLESSRVGIGEAIPDMIRYVVAVDPSGADDDENKNNDEIGIGVAGITADGIAYVFEDLTLKAGPATWGKVAVDAYHKYKADYVVAEQNYGGAMCEFVIRSADPNVSYKKVTASHGKTVRAIPIAGLHEQGKIKFVKEFVDLEDELLAFTTAGYSGSRSPNRADWFVWAITELFEEPEAVPYIWFA